MGVETLPPSRGKRPGLLQPHAHNIRVEKIHVKHVGFAADAVRSRFGIRDILGRHQSAIAVDLCDGKIPAITPGIEIALLKPQ